MASSTASLDFETYSAAGYVIDTRTGLRAGGGIKDVGAVKYSEHPSTDILCAAYKLPGSANVDVWLPGYPPPVALFDHIKRGGLLCAFNVSFEFWVWENVGVKKYGWMSLQPYQRQLRCTEAAARAYALPGSLGKVAEVLGTSAQKDRRGTQLINLFSKPQPQARDRHLLANPPPVKLRMTFQDDPDAAQEMISYCVQDVRTEIAVYECIPDLECTELGYWQCDQARNRRGVSIDARAVDDCIEVVETVLAECAEELKKITGDSGIKASSVPKLTAWLRARTNGVITSLAADSVREYLAMPLPPDVRRVLEIRQASASTSIKKLYAMQRRICDSGRVYEIFKYHTARTGRASGSSIQPQNLPSSGSPVVVCASGHYSPEGARECIMCGGGVSPAEWGVDSLEETLVHARLGGAPLLKLTRGDVLKSIAGCLRGMFIAAPGHRLICSDYNAIEAVVIAQLAVEDWRLEVFRTHGKIYESSAAKISGTPLDVILEHKETTGTHHPLRKLGKVAELASAYQGWVGAWKAFGADDYFTDESDMKKSILAWRAASPRIVALWLRAHVAAVTSMMSCDRCDVCPGVYYQYSEPENALFCTLPSGRKLTYHAPRVVMGDRGEQIVFMGWNSDSSKGKVGWVEIQTYGGKLVENIVQAVARDILAHAVVRLERAGYAVVLDVHDEIVCEMPDGSGSVAELERIMSTMPAWAEGWAVKATGGWEGKRYRK